VRDFFRHGALVFAGLIAANVLTLFYYATVSRAVGVDDAGLFSSLISAILIFSVPGNIAAVVMAKVVADACARGEQGIAVFLARWAASLFVPLLAFFALVDSLENSAVATFFHTSDHTLVLLVGAGISFTALLAPLRAVLQGKGNFQGFAMSNIVEGVGKAATGLLTYILGGGLRFALMGYGLSVALAFGISALLTAGGHRPQKPRISRASGLHHLLGTALPIGAITLMTFADVVLVRHFLPAYDSGLYGASALVGRAILTIIAFVPTVLLPKASAHRATGRSPLRLLAAALLMTGVVVGGILAATAIFPSAIVSAVAGRAFADAAPLVFPYALAMAFLAGATVLSVYLIGIDRASFALPLTAIAAVEIALVGLFHASTHVVLEIVICGHAGAFIVCATDAGFSLRYGRDTSQSADIV
jgi:O-antigen/teichoic acid export membrane protein